MASVHKELRVALDPDLHAVIIAMAKARRTTPAALISEAWSLYINTAPRLLAAAEALEKAREDADRIGAIADFIGDLYRQEADAEAAE